MRAFIRASSSIETVVSLSKIAHDDDYQHNTQTIAFLKLTPRARWTMPFEVSKTAISDVLIIEPNVWQDTRGFFFESFNQREFNALTGTNTTFVQDNHSLSHHGILRGLHYQLQQPQGKLVRVIKGEIFDVAVDMRFQSETFGQWVGAKLTAENHRQLWLPPGFAHGFLVLSEVAEVLFKTTQYWIPEQEHCLLWSDTEVNIAWPLKQAPLVASKDLSGKRLSELPPVMNG